MNDEINLQITETGTIRSIYKDGHSQELKELLGADMNVNRASHVEWEKIDGVGGWTVRAAWDPELAIRHCSESCTPFVEVNRKGNIAIFPTREEALKEEVKLFWYLLPKEK